MEQRPGTAAVNWVNRFTHRVMPLVLGLMVFLFAATAPGISVGQAMLEPFVDDRAELPVLFGFAILCAVAAVLARRWRWPLFTVTAVSWLALTIYPTVLVSSYYAAIHLNRRRHAIAFLVCAVALVAVPAVMAHGMADQADIGLLIAVVLVGLLVLLPYAIGLWVVARRQVIGGLQERAARLELEQATRADQAKAQERARIAREMHDVVAHRVALMVLHAGALEVNAPDERLAEEASLIRITGREALTELRQVLGVLRDETGAEPAVADLAPQPDLTHLARLLDQTRAAGQPVSYALEGEPRTLPLVVQRTAYRIVQEGLTNVVKHTGGAQAAVTLRYLRHNIEVKVESGPPLAGREPMPGSGLGLIGLRERVALLYGRFEARPRLDGGFSLSAVLPDEARAVPT